MNTRDVQARDAVATIEKWKGDAGWATWLEGDARGVSHAWVHAAVGRVVAHLISRSNRSTYIVLRLNETNMNGNALLVRGVTGNDPDAMDRNLTIETLRAMVRML